MSTCHKVKPGNWTISKLKFIVTGAKPHNKGTMTTKKEKTPNEATEPDQSPKKAKRVNPQKNYSTGMDWKSMIHRVGSGSTPGSTNGSFPGSFPPRTLTSVGGYDGRSWGTSQRLPSPPPQILPGLSICFPGGVPWGPGPPAGKPHPWIAAELGWIAPAKWGPRALVGNLSAPDHNGAGHPGAILDCSGVQKAGQKGSPMPIAWPGWAPHGASGESGWYPPNRKDIADVLSGPALA